VARATSLLSLRTWIRQLSDTENDDNVSDDELTALVNRHLAEVYDLLVDAGPPDYFASSTTVAVTSGISSYAIQADFRSLVAVFVHESSEERRLLLPMGEMTRGRYKAPTQDGTLTVEYIPAAPVLVDDAESFDGVSGWEELIVARSAVDVMTKRESDPSASLAKAQMLEARIKLRARNRDRGSPKRIVDLDEVTSMPPYGWTGGSRLACFRLRAGNIEVFEPLTVCP
jgi:hypothetical protein